MFLIFSTMNIYSLTGEKRGICNNVREKNWELLVQLKQFTYRETEAQGIKCQGQAPRGPHGRVKVTAICPRLHPQSL